MYILKALTPWIESKDMNSTDGVPGRHDLVTPAHMSFAETHRWSLCLEKKEGDALTKRSVPIVDTNGMLKSHLEYHDPAGLFTATTTPVK